MKKLFIFILTSFLLLSCGTQKSPQNPEISKNKIEKTQITTSILPLASLVNTLGGEKIEVKNIVGAGKSPHNFDLKSSDLVNIEKADGIVMLGLEHIDGFLDKSLDGKNVLQVSDGIELLEMGEHEHEEEEHSDEEHHDDHKKDHLEDEDGHEEEHSDEHEEEHNHDDHESDPHIWNGPKNAKVIAGKIRDFLSQLQTKNTEIFEKNHSDFVGKIDILVKDFQTKTHGKKQNYFIVFHDAYNYLFADLGIENEKKLIFRKSVLSDPNSQDMKNLIDEVKRHSVKIAFVEPQFKNSNFEKVAKKYNIKMYVLDPLGNDESADGYLKNLKNNLESLEKIFDK